MPRARNNPFGIEASEDQPSVESSTREVIDGHAATVTARFRKLDPLAEAFYQHGKLLAAASVYKAAMALTQGPDMGVSAVRWLIYCHV